MKFTYNLEKKEANTKARLGSFEYNGVKYETPMFMPVGTQATVKTLSPEEVRGLGSGIILANTYHLWLRPGEDIVFSAGGLHKFMNWDGPILTDSGGYQVFSLANPKDISEEGVKFKNYLNGDNLFLTPEKSIAIQNKLDSDIAMSFDECPPASASHEYMEKSIKKYFFTKMDKTYTNYNNETFNLVNFVVVHTFLVDIKSDDEIIVYLWAIYGSRLDRNYDYEIINPKGVISSPYKIVLKKTNDGYEILNVYAPNDKTKIDYVDSYLFIKNYFPKNILKKAESYDKTLLYQDFYNLIENYVYQ